MNLTGRIENVGLDWKTDKLTITLQVNEKPTDEINDLMQHEKLAIDIKKYRQKRSLNANALLWNCLGEIATAMNPPADKWDVYLLMLKRYGKYTYICVKPAVVDAVKAQWRECQEIGTVNINGQEAVQMLCYFGSSTYNTKEFSVLLDGVVSEMKEMGLQPPLSQDMKRALEEWEKKTNGKEKEQKSIQRV